MKWGFGISLLLTGFLAGTPGILAGEHSQHTPGKEEYILRVNGFRMTREEIDRKYAHVLSRSGGDAAKERITRGHIVAEQVKELLLAEYASRHIVLDEGFLADLRRNSGNEFLADRWLGPRIAKEKDIGAKRKRAREILRNLEKKARVKRHLPLLGKDGKVPEDDQVVAEVRKEKIRFGRVRAFACRTYDVFRAWPGEPTERFLRDTLEGVIRLEVVAQASREQKLSPPGDSLGREEVYRNYLTTLAIGKLRHEASLPDNEIDAKVKQRLPLSHEALYPLQVIVFKAVDPKDLEDFSREIRGIPTGNKGVGSRVYQVKYGSSSEYWLPKGFLPPSLERATLEVPEGKQFSEIVKVEEEHYLVRILRRQPPPEVDVASIKRNLEGLFRNQKFEALVREAIEKVRSEVEVEIREDLL